MTQTVDPFGTVTTDLSATPPSDTALTAPAEMPPLSTDPLPEISYLEAESRRAELFGNEEWRTRFFGGDVEAARQYRQVVQGLTTRPVVPTNEREQILDELRRHAHIPPEVTEEILSGRASTPADVAEALDAKRQFFNDEAWLERYAKGGRQENTQLAMINLILSRRVRDDPFQP